VFFVKTRRRRLALAAAVVLAGSVGVYAYEASAGPEQVRLSAVSCDWRGPNEVRVFGTVSNPNGSAENLTIVPAYQLATGGMQNIHITSSGTKDGSPLAGHAVLHWTFTRRPNGNDWRGGEPFARCVPTTRIQTGNPDDD
jgi:hypothetical protein